MDGPEGTDQTALMIAARENNVDSLKVLVENGAERSLPCKLGWAKKPDGFRLGGTGEARESDGVLKVGDVTRGNRQTYAQRRSFVVAFMTVEFSQSLLRNLPRSNCESPTSATLPSEFVIALTRSE